MHKNNVIAATFQWKYRSGKRVQCKVKCLIEILIESVSIAIITGVSHDYPG